MIEVFTRVIYLDHSKLFCLSLAGGGEISFIGSGSSDWFDPNNWQTELKLNDIGLYSKQLPCQYDTVTFSKVSFDLQLIQYCLLGPPYFVGSTVLNNSEQKVSVGLPTLVYN